MKKKKMNGYLLAGLIIKTLPLFSEAPGTFPCAPVRDR